MFTRRWASLATVAVIAVATGACEPDVTEPFTESITQLDAAAQSSHAAAGESARGHVEQGLDRYSFTARRQRDGSVRGQFQVFINVGTEFELRAHGEVTCMTVLPDGTARLGGVVTHSEPSLPEGLPAGTFWAVRDNGEGGDQQDDATGMFFGVPAEFVELHCAVGFGFPLTPSVHGNVQVTS